MADVEEEGGDEEEVDVDEVDVVVLVELRFVEVALRTAPELVQVTLAVQLVISVQNLWRYVEVPSPKPRLHNRALISD